MFMAQCFRLGGSVAHPLIGRYAFSQTCKYGHFRYSTNITMYLY
ncbi:hypothetical protein THF1C08_890005 [Vibrio jasicida]|uniref:DUF3265 domain-containing protein n=1 Tax=Vibrio jasicida TaxID=766224 RepID=A0AAU9QYL1_9VIBR|nr:hypothetical protein THF1C08_890005 [Vibrio jasicida]CAH1604079.1 hypothetical protein THF1A12_900005 [Vibrio jasicida]